MPRKILIALLAFAAICTILYVNTEQKIIVTEISSQDTAPPKIDSPQMTREFFQEQFKLVEAEENTKNRHDARVAKLKAQHEWKTNLIDVCEVIGVKSDDFRDFVNSKGIKASSPGGDEFHLIRVHKDDLKLFIELVDKPAIVEEFDVRFLQN